MKMKMKNFNFATVFFISFLYFGTMLYASGSSSTTQTPFQMHKGINISTWLVFNASTNSSELAQYFTKEHFDELVSMGFTHFRLPFHEQTLYKSIRPLERDTGNFNLVHNFIGWCQEAGVTVALNYHISRASKSTLGADNNTGATERYKMVNVWNDLSLAFNSYDNETLAYEIFNEPKFSSDSIWNVFANEMINKIRQREPERVIIVAPNGDNHVNKVSALSLPVDKNNLVVSVHFYAPVALTHYNTGGLTGIFVRLNYPGQIITSAAMAELTQEQRDYVIVHTGNFTVATQKIRLQPLLDYAASNNVRIQIGEYGSNNQYEQVYNDDMDIKLRYFQDIVQVFDDLNIPHSVWGYKKSFGLFNDEGELNDPRIVQAITGYNGAPMNILKETGETSVPKLSKPLFKLYPAITSDNINLNDVEESGVGVIYNINGKVMQTIRIQSDETYTIPVNHFPSGLYLFKIGDKTRRFIKQ
jgi:endoglucanase